jgi:hypothetical protein
MSLDSNPAMKPARMDAEEVLSAKETTVSAVLAVKGEKTLNV